ncbi:MAG: response regulator, partial [Thermoanaerobaculia bacterium]
MPRILILDDRPINRQFLTTLLTYKGYETREASDGAEGLKIARTWRPDLAIVDIEMPGMNGIEFVRHVHADAQLGSTPIIFYTASYEASEAARLARESGVDSVLMKPSEPAVILATIELALGRMGSRHRAALAEEAAAEFIRIHADAMRISALVEFQLEISAQRRPHEILSTLARASRNIVASEHSILTMFDGERIFGISNSKDNHNLLPDAAHAWSPHCREHLQLLVQEGKPLRTTHPAECAQCLIGEIAVRSYIGVPIQTAKKSYGWLCLVNHEDANEYSPEDERIVQTIAAQTAMAYENLLLYEEIRSEAELLDQNVNLLRTTIEASSDGILVIDRASRIVTYNQRLAELWRVPLDILRAADGRKCLEHSLALVKDPRGYQDAVDRAIQGEELTRTYELRDGRYVECHVAPRTLKGEIIGRVWNFRDVTASVRAEEALRASEEKYRSLISNIPDVTWTADAHA